MKELNKNCYHIEVDIQGSALCRNRKLNRNFCVEHLLDENWEYPKCKHKEESLSTVNSRNKFEKWKKKELAYWGV